MGLPPPGLPSRRMETTEDIEAEIITLDILIERAKSARSEGELDKVVRDFRCPAQAHRLTKKEKARRRLDGPIDSGREAKWYKELVAPCICK